MLDAIPPVSKRRKVLLLDEREQFTFDFGGAVTEPIDPDSDACPSPTEAPLEGAPIAPLEELNKQTADPLDAEEVQKCFDNAFAGADRVLIAENLDEAVAQFQHALRRYGEAALRQERAKRRGAAVKQRTDRVGVKNRNMAPRSKDSVKINARKFKKG